MSTFPSPDAKAVVRAVEALTTQVGRIADTLSTPVVRYEVAADDDATTPVACPLCPALRFFTSPADATEHFRNEHAEQRLTLWPWAMPTPPADGATTPATTCSAQHHGHASGPRECIRAGQHHGDHIDEQGYHWSDTVAIYPVADGPDFTSPLAGRIEVRRPCPYCGDRQMIPTHQYDEHVARLHPDVRTGGPGIPVPPADEDAQHDAACRVMETRTCPPAYNGPCGDRPCARFESDDPTPWTDPAPAAPRPDEDQALRWARRESLLVILTRLQRGRSLTEAEAGTLRHHVETEIREADTARRSAEQAGQRLGRICDMADAWERRLPATIRTATAAEAVRLAAIGDDRPVMFGVQPDAGLHAELAEAQAAIERVRAIKRAPTRSDVNTLANAQDNGWDAALFEVQRALDGTEQPTTEQP